MVSFPFNENRFPFFVADHLLVGQLCTNPKSDRSLLSCLKVTQYSTSEIGDAPLDNSCSLPIQVMTTEPLPTPSKCKSGKDEYENFVNALLEASKQRAEPRVPSETLVVRKKACRRENRLSTHRTKN